MSESGAAPSGEPSASESGDQKRRTERERERRNKSGEPGASESAAAPCGEPSVSESAAPKRRTERERKRRAEAVNGASGSAAPRRRAERSESAAERPHKEPFSPPETAAPHRSGEPSGAGAATSPLRTGHIFMFKYTLFLLHKNYRSGGFYAAAPVKSAENCAVYTKTLAVIW